MIPVTLLMDRDGVHRTYPIEFSIPKMYGSLNLYNLLKPKYKSDMVENEDGTYLNYDEATDSLIFPVCMVNRLSKLLYQLGQQLDLSPFSIFKHDSLNISDRYLNSKEPDLGALWDNQYEAVQKLCTKMRGVFEAGTGYGKNSIIVYLCSHYVGSGNILIIAPRNSILSVIAERCLQYKIGVKHISEIDTAVDKIAYTHPAGIVNSNVSKDPNKQEWLSHVDMILIDECESIPDSVESILRYYCTSYRYIYGFSATADKYNGRSLSDIMWSSNFNTTHPDTFSILYFVGESGYYKKDEHNFTIYLNYVDDIPKEYWKWYPRGNNEGEPFNARYARMEDTTIKCDATKRYLTWILETRHKSGTTLLVPVKTISQADAIWEMILSINPKLSIMYWTGQGSVYHNTKNDDNAEDIQVDEIADPYTYMKGKVDDERDCDILIVTSVGYRGVDCANINDVLLSVGGNNGIVNQIAGRLTRGDTDDLNIYLLGNYLDLTKQNNGRELTPILNSVVWKRINHIKGAHGKVTLVRMHNQVTM